MAAHDEVIDPGNRSAVEPILLAWLRERWGPGVRLRDGIGSPGDGLSTFIWFFEPVGPDVEAEWRRPLVLRIYSAPWRQDEARKEARIHAWLVTHRYPAPVVRHSQPDDSPFGLPFLVMDRAPGDVMLRRVVRRPHQAGAIFRHLADLQHLLHQLPIDDRCPLGYDPDVPLVEDRLSDLRSKIDAGNHDDARPGLAWLEERADLVAAEAPAFLHNDFHPLNALIDGHPATGRVTVIDWSDASIGDVHHDVGRTLALFRVAAIAAGSAPERIALQRAHPWMARTYRAAYERHHPLDDDRLRYWQALHVLRGWLQVREIHAPPDWTEQRALTPQAQQVPAEIGDQLLAWFGELSRSFAT